MLCRMLNRLHRRPTEAPILSARVTHQKKRPD